MITPAIKGKPDCTLERLLLVGSEKNILGAKTQMLVSCVQDMYFICCMTTLASPVCGVYVFCL